MIADKKCKVCRRAGEKLFLRGDRCFTPKCAFERKAYAPGKRDSERKHRGTVTEYGTQLREKQKIRNVYRISERQFSRYVKEATAKSSGNPAEGLYEALESRLDSAAYRAGFAASRAEARQIVSHGHLTVNGRRVTVPSYAVKAGDTVAVRKASEGKTPFLNIMKDGAGAEGAEKRGMAVPVWMKIDMKTKTAAISGKPRMEAGEMAGAGMNFKSVIEFYSR